MNVSLRLCTEADIDTADALLMAAYQFQRSIKKMLQHYYFPIQPNGWWLALADETPLGFGGAVHYGTLSSIGMLAVSPKWQCHGIGQALVRQIIAWCEMQNCSTVMLEAAPKAVSLYERLGFVREDTTLQMVRKEPFINFQPSSDVKMLQKNDLSQIAAFDAFFFGADRIKVLLPHWEDRPDRAFVTRDRTGQVTGYLFARQRIIGPWVASTVSDAERLLVQALSLPFENAPEVSIPATNQEGIMLLRRYGFQQQEVDHFMLRGAPYPGQRAMIYAQASPALG
jgi:GNAT superfamily N-acetyltransferase